MSDDSGSVKEQVIQVIKEPDVISSGDEPPMSEWSSLVIELPEENRKKALFAESLYSPGSGEVCGEYISLSDSDVPRHVYYNYPAVLDPGIEDALFVPEKHKIYKDDGQDLYLVLCNDMNQCPVRKFHRSLITDEIDLKYYCVNPLGVRPMAMALRYNKTVQRLDLTGSFLNDDSCYHLGQMLITNSTLKELILAGCRIGPSGIVRLGCTLAINRGLKMLDISKCCLGEEGGVHFAKLIADGAGIPRVNLSYNQLGRQTAFALAEALQFRNKFTHLDLSWNNFFHVPSVVKMLAEFAGSTILRKLNLAWNAMEGERIATQIKEVLLIPTLNVLNLSNNRFMDDAVSIFISNLIYAKKLHTFDLSFNPMTAMGARCVLEKMTRPRVKIDNLNLDGIAVDVSFVALLETVKQMKARKNFTIKYGHVSHNWTVKGPDARTLLLERADYLGKSHKKHRMDIGVFFLKIGKEKLSPIPIKDLVDIKNTEGAPLDDDLINELGVVFAGPKTAKSKTVDVQLICEYVRRLWPERRAPPSPPPEPAPPPPPPPAKGKKGKKK